MSRLLIKRLLLLLYSVKATDHYISDLSPCGNFPLPLLGGPCKEVSDFCTFNPLLVVPLLSYILKCSQSHSHHIQFHFSPIHLNHNSLPSVLHTHTKTLLTFYFLHPILTHTCIHTLPPLITLSSVPINCLPYEAEHKLLEGFFFIFPTPNNLCGFSNDPTFTRD